MTQHTVRGSALLLLHHGAQLQLQPCFVGLFLRLESTCALIDSTRLRVVGAFLLALGARLRVAGSLLRVPGALLRICGTLLRVTGALLRVADATLQSGELRLQVNVCFIVTTVLLTVIGEIYNTNTTTPSVCNT